MIGGLTTRWSSVPLRYWFVVLYANNLLNQAFAIVCTIAVATTILSETDNTVLSILLFFTNWGNLFGVCIINVMVLSTFSVLIPVLTRARLTVWYRFNVVLFAATVWTTFLDTFTSTMIIASVGGWVVVCDNLQAATLAWVVFSWKRKKSKSKGKLGIEFVRAMSLNYALVVLDWIGLSLLIMTYFTDSDTLHQTFSGLASALSGLHCVGLFFVFQALKKIALDGAKLENVHRPSPPMPNGLPDTVVEAISK
ncbi:hypothetical protein HDU91_002948 [Kappamyces sp. JEL0680]|nr:hypothetical protein HDU91_002948 [Kappamyces sp. JEL0680]